jgi:hypothetical protein
MVAATAIASLIAIYYRDRGRYCRQRRNVFADCLELFENYRLVQDGLAFAVLEGTYRGYRVELEPVVDNVAFRKLPSLWLKVTLRAPVRYDGVFDLLIRPRGGEFYSPFAELEHEVSIPQDWPSDAILHGDDPARMPPTEIIAPHVRLFADSRMKELLVTPRGVRLVYQVSQAERTHYLVLRQIEFPEGRLPFTLVRRLLDATVELHASVAHAA